MDEFSFLVQYACAFLSDSDTRATIAPRRCFESLHRSAGPPLPPDVVFPGNISGVFLTGMNVRIKREQQREVRCFMNDPAFRRCSTNYPLGGGREINSSRPAEVRHGIHCFDERQSQAGLDSRSAREACAGVLPFREGPGNS